MAARIQTGLILVSATNHDCECSCAGYAETSGDAAIHHSVLLPIVKELTGAVIPSPIHADNEHGVAPEKEKPGLKLLASKHDMVRAWPGGFGNAKVGANYGPSLIAQGEARDLGFDQILWLFGPQCEVTKFVTAPLGDKVILEGVTRKSVLGSVEERLIASLEDLEELEIVERKYTMREVEEAIEEGTAIYVAIVCG